MSFLNEVNDFQTPITQTLNTCENCPTVSSNRIAFECFSEIEKGIITWYISKVEALIATRAPKLRDSSYVWQILNPKSKNEGIVITPKTMSTLFQGYKFQDSNIISSGFHFFFKAYLRDYLRRNMTQHDLNKIYKKYWGYDFKPIKLASGKLNMGYVVNLKFHGNQRDYHPTLVNSVQGLSPVMVELVSRTNNCFEVTNVIRAIDSAECILSRFNGLYAPTTGTIGISSSSNSCKNDSDNAYGVKLQEIVDPNKIFVTMISEYVVSNYRFIGNNPAAPDVFNAIDELIGNDCLSNVGQLAYPL